MAIDDSIRVSPDVVTALDSGPTIKNYAVVTSVLILFSIGLFWITRQYGELEADAEAVLAPIFALVGLIGLVWLTMVVLRNYAILKKITSGIYYERYVDDLPPDWVERPARTFNNLMQVPSLFFLACIIMLLTGYTDRAQMMLVWIFVASRYLHAAIYMIWNYVPARFGCFMAGSITLIVIYTRLVLDVLY
ncbi:MAG: hypothetical protein COB20_06700 [SAR86 cluster bacterium]|uniref:MAPEG family protein n=1 Tax=SAR86 cluster bacterium TaxID=2030880 RepID=A0A2A4X8S9_9GAMM|nr:MAG: hypothetical protein COB20_06700 [SAR86 cluster bacterium]